MWGCNQSLTHIHILDADLGGLASPTSWGWVTQMHQTRQAGWGEG